MLVPEARLFDLCNPGNNLGPIGQALGVPGGVEATYPSGCWPQGQEEVSRRTLHCQLVQGVGPGAPWGGMEGLQNLLNLLCSLLKGGQWPERSGT